MIILQKTNMATEDINGVIDMEESWHVIQINWKFFQKIESKVFISLDLHIEIILIDESDDTVDTLLLLILKMVYDTDLFAILLYTCMHYNHVTTGSNNNNFTLIFFSLILPSSVAVSKFLL